MLFNEKLEEKDLQLFATKFTEKIPDPRNAKEHYQSFLRTKNTTTSHKLSKSKNVSHMSSNNSLYSETKKLKKQQK